ncbi:MAG: hypothetical protein J6C28_06795 [Bacilli bacterium]|nr:hypothetical protein [Bacilli bacterium]
MEHNRKQKLLIIVALIVGIASLSIGFAAFSVSLNISSSASVTPSSDTFKVKFSTSKDSLVEGAVVPSSITSGITATNGVIVNSSNPTITNLSATFTGPGQYVEYTFYARNEGEYTAYLNNVSFIGNQTCTAEAGTTDSLVQNVCAYINILFISDTRTYFEDTPVSGHSLSPKSSDVYTIRLEYTDAAPSADGPFSITFPDVALVYSTIDDSTMKPDVVRLESGDLNTPGSIVSIGDEQFYVFGQEDGNVKLLAMHNLYVGHGVDENLGTLSMNETGIQDERAIAYYSEFPFWGAVYYPQAEGYASDYGEYLEGLGANVSNSRLITNDELESLGCSSTDKTCIDAPEWVYSSSYYTSSYVDVEQEYIYVVYSDGDYHGGDADYDYYYGVRPVIEIPLSEFE